MRCAVSALHKANWLPCCSFQCCIANLITIVRSETLGAILIFDSTCPGSLNFLANDKSEDTS